MKLPQLPHVGPRTRKVLRYTGITLVGIITFVFAVQMTLPIERAKETLIERFAPSYDITIGSVERGWVPGRVYLNAVAIRSRPTTPGELPTTIYIERLKGDVGLLALLGSTLSIDFDAKIGAGHIAGNVALLGWGNKGIDAHITGRALPASNLPMSGLLGLPMSGKLEFSVALDLPYETP
jgi:type II secretion system protein N